MLAPFLRATASCCHRMAPLELAPTLLGLAYMGCAPGAAAPAAEELLRQVALQRRQCTQELANALWGFSKASVGRQPAENLRPFCHWAGKLRRRSL